jgi:hypothetical protein
MLVPNLPINAVGKIDRNALPAPIWSKPKKAEGAARDMTPMESKLCIIITRILGYL